MATFPKSERLCGQLTIRQLYSEGSKFTVWPLRVTYRPADRTRVLIWAPKSQHKHAVERNLLRRRMREAWRLNKHLLGEEHHYELAINYMDKVVLPSDRISRAMQTVLTKLNK